MTEVGIDRLSWVPSRWKVWLSKITALPQASIPLIPPFLPSSFCLSICLWKGSHKEGFDVVNSGLMFKGVCFSFLSLGCCSPCYLLSPSISLPCLWSCGPDDRRRRFPPQQRTLPGMIRLIMPATNNFIFRVWLRVWGLHVTVITAEKGQKDAHGPQWQPNLSNGPIYCRGNRTVNKIIF